MVSISPTIRPLNVIGLNSGTSMDGIDAALFQIKPDKLAASTNGDSAPKLMVEMKQSVLYPFDSAFQKHLKTFIAQGTTSLDEICRLNFALGELFAKAALQLIQQARASREEVDLIGSHGQTIWHAPEASALWGVASKSTLQLGEPSVIAARTGIPVVADFRVQDMAWGGQGAPLVAFADEVLFGAVSEPTGVLNLGGIANITVIDQSGHAIMAFDTGPGNTLIDRATKKLFDTDCDWGGKLAAQGQINEAWLKELLEHKYFQQTPPKTTGREVFGDHYADQLIAEAKQRNITHVDCLATLTALTAASIAQAYERFVLPKVKLSRLVLGGGGAENETMRLRLVHFFPHAISLNQHEDFNISTKFKEALLFALLAYTTYFHIENNIPACTGARRKVCLGKICLPF